MTLAIKKITKNEWLDNSHKFYDLSYTHYWEYSKQAANHIGGESENVAFVTMTGEIIGLCNIRIRALPFSLGGVAYISGGPVLYKRQDSYWVDYLEAVDLLKKEYVLNRGLVLRVSQRLKGQEFMDMERDVFLKKKFTIHSQTNATMMVSMAADLVAIRSGLHKKWRNILNKSEKNDIEIVTSNDASLFKDFGILFKELLATKAFDIQHDDQFFLTVQQKTKCPEGFRLSIAYKDGRAVSGILFSISGDTSVYILGATNNLGRKLGAAYLLQWHVIKLSKDANCRWYDLGGVDKKNNPNVYQFKERMGGSETPLGLKLQFYSGFRGKLTLIIEKIYKLYKLL